MSRVDVKVTISATPPTQAECFSLASTLCVSANHTACRPCMLQARGVLAMPAGPCD